MMVAGEFAALKQRYVITSEDTSALKNAPNENLAIAGRLTGWTI